MHQIEREEDKAVILKKENDLHYHEIEPPDGRTAWIQCLAVFNFSFITFGLVYATGIFLNAVANELDSPLGWTSLVFSTSSGMLFITGFVGGILSDRYEVRWVTVAGVIIAATGLALASYSQNLMQLFIAYGLIMGFGLSIALNASASIMGQWFLKYRGVGIGLAMTGSAISNLVFPVFATYIESRYGWRNLFLILAIFMAVLLLISALILKRRIPPIREKISISPYIFKRTFFMLFISTFFGSVSFIVPTVYIINYCLHHDVTEFKAALTISVMGVSNIFGRVVLGYLSDKVNRVRLYQFASFLMIVITAAWYFCTDFYSIVAFVFLFGLFSGTTITTLPAIIADYYPQNVLGSMTSSVMFLRGIAYLTGPPFAGFLYEHMDSYTPIIILCTVCNLIAFILIIYLPSQSKAVSVEEYLPLKSVSTTLYSPQPSNCTFTKQ